MFENDYHLYVFHHLILMVYEAVENIFPAFSFTHET